MKMNPNDTSRILDAVAADFIPANVNLLPQIAVRFERKTLMQTLRARPALIILLTLLALGLLTGVAYAVSRSLGYIPGVGMVEQGALIRTLAEPVSQTRDGMTVTVTEAVLTADKTFVLFTTENVPFSALPNNENVAGCSGAADLRLPDGKILRIVEGGGGMGKMRFVYAPLPADVNEATFVLPCLMNTLPGLAPENWELTLRFKPAPPELTVVPVIEIAPTPTSVSINTPTTAAEPSPVELTNALKIDDLYVLMGITKQPESGSWIELRDSRLTDANGAEIYTQIPQIPDLPNFDWGMQFKADGVNFPVTLTFHGVRIAPLPDSSAEFEFDAGEDPQPGQEWRPNQDIQIGGRTIRLVSVRTDSRAGYSFEFAGDPDVTGLSVEIAGHTADGGGGGGGLEAGQFSLSLMYAKLPTGKLKIILSALTIASPPQTWTIQWSPENAPAVDSLYGIALKLDKFIPLEDGYYMIGHTEWTDERIKSVFPAEWNLKAIDANGGEVPIEPADAQEAGLVLESNQWIYKIYGKAFNAPVTLRAIQVTVEFVNPVRLSLDLRPYNFTFSDDKIDIPFKTGLIPLDVPGILANAFKATYYKEGEMYGFEVGIEAAPALQGLGFRIESGLDITGLDTIGGGGGSNRDEASGLVLSTVLTNAKMTFPLVLRADGAAINGAWDITWNPPAAEPGATPVIMPQACVTLEDWKQALKSPGAIPSGLPRKVFVSHGSLFPEPSMFISSLDGSHEQGLAFGQGDLSPDGSKLAYSDENGLLHILEIASGQKVTLTDGFSPFWSSDGIRIAFSRQTDKGHNIYVMDAVSGKNMRTLTDSTDSPILLGWMPDNLRLIQLIWTPDDGHRTHALDVETGELQPLLINSQSEDISVMVSPDGTTWAAYIEKVAGKMAAGLYVSRLDGSEKRLLVQLDHWMVGWPLWAPDTLSSAGGKWLAFSVHNTDRMRPEGIPALINVETCQVVPLISLNGGIHGWVK